MGRPPSSDDCAVLCEINAPVDVAVAVGDSAPLALCGALLSRSAGVTLPINHQLDPFLSPGLREERVGKVKLTYNNI